MRKKQIDTHLESIVMDKQYPGFNPVQFGNENCLPGHSYGPAVRTHWLLHYVVKGAGVFVREGSSYPIGAGDVFVIEPYQETFYQADAINPWEYIWIGFTAPDALTDEFRQPVIRHAGVGAVFEDMLRCYRMEHGKSAFLSSRIWELVSLLLEQESGNIGYVEKAISCIHSEYMNGITVTQIAGRLNLDRSYFSMLFKKKQGISPQQYLMQYRLEKAAELMVVYGEKPSVACVSVGYPDLYNFSRMFKAYFGVSPRVYQQKKRGQDMSGSLEK